MRASWGSSTRISQAGVGTSHAPIKITMNPRTNVRVKRKTTKGFTRAGRLLAMVVSHRFLMLAYLSADLAVMNRWFKLESRFSPTLSRYDAKNQQRPRLDSTIPLRDGA